VAAQRASLVAQLEYALKRDFSGVLQRLQTQQDDAKNDAAALDKQEVLLLSKEEELRTAMRALNDKVASVKQEREKANQLVKNKLSARANVTEERESFAKKLASEEILIERARSQLHEVLQKAQVEEIALPTLDIDTESDQGVDEELRWGGDSQNKSQGTKKRQRGSDRGGNGSDDTSNGGSKTTSDSTHFSQSDNRAVVADRNKAAKVDLSSMRKLKSLSKQELAVYEATQLQRIAALVAELETMQPNMHALERFENVTEKLKECEAELAEHNFKTGEISERFQDVNSNRTRLFKECFDHVSNVLGVIYKDLTKSTKHPAGGNAYLTLEDSNTPFVGGTRFTAMPPMKRFRDMADLSGGEKTMAALALLFSIHSYRQAPFFVLDEVDAALDNVNVKKVSF
jgi:structural maintenance of chromosome 1